MVITERKNIKAIMVRKMKNRQTSNNNNNVNTEVKTITVLAIYKLLHSPELYLRKMALTRGVTLGSTTDVKFWSTFKVQTAHRHHQIDISLCFSGHFPGEPGLAGTRMSSF